MSPSEQQLLLASKQLISLSEAAPFTPYSAEYLGLLARKGKLKAVKISRDWMTTKEIVEEYVKEQEPRYRKFMEKFYQVPAGGLFPIQSDGSVSNKQFGTASSGFSSLSLLLSLGAAIAAVSGFLVVSLVHQPVVDDGQPAVMH